MTIRTIRASEKTLRDDVRDIIDAITAFEDNLDQNPDIDGDEIARVNGIIDTLYRACGEANTTLTEAFSRHAKGRDS